MTDRDLAGRATGTGTHHHAIQVQPDQRGLGAQAGNGEAGGAAQPVLIHPKDNGFGRGLFQRNLKVIAQMGDAGALALAIGRAPRRQLQAGGAGKIFGAGAQALLLAAAHQLRLKRRGFAHDKRATTLRTADLVR